MLIWVAALAGFVYCYFKKDRYYLLPCFLLGFVPILFFYPDRFWDAHALVPLAMLGGVALSALHGFLGKRFASLICDRRARSALVACAMSVPVILFLLVDPVYSTARRKKGAPAAAARRLAQQQYGAAQQPDSGYPPGDTLPPGAELRKSIPGAAPPGVIPPEHAAPSRALRLTARDNTGRRARAGRTRRPGRNTGIGFRSSTLLDPCWSPR